MTKPKPCQTACWMGIVLIPLALARSIHAAWTIRAHGTK